MTSPCSVNLISPSRTPHGWARIESYVGPPPRRARRRRRGSSTRCSSRSPPGRRCGSPPGSRRTRRTSRSPPRPAGTGSAPAVGARRVRRTTARAGRCGVRRRRRCRARRAGQEGADGVVVGVGVLAHVHRGQGESERRDQAADPGHAAVGDQRTPVLAQRRADQVEVGEQLAGVAVVHAGLVRGAVDDTALDVAQLQPDAAQLQPVRLGPPRRRPRRPRRRPSSASPLHRFVPAARAPGVPARRCWPAGSTTRTPGPGRS